MPLLKRKAFEKSTASGYLRDDDEVFHCEITDEIFKDYEEYCERIILVNSMVWSCEMTGKNNLTYAEALESEKAARRSLKDFPMELRIPILFLAAKTKRSSFAEMSEDVFNFVRERFFVGESVEACLEGDSWKESHVLSVTVQKQQPGSKTTPPAASYCYEVEQFEEEGGAAGTVGAAPHDRVRRRKGVFSREKCRLFLKQFVEMAPGGLIGIKKATLDKYNISKVNYEQIFVGTPPEFPSSKKLLKTPPTSSKKAKPGSANKLNNSKTGSATKLNNSAKKGTPDKKKQESMDKFLKKTPSGTEAGASQKKSPDPAAKKSAQELADKMRRAEEQMRKRREEEKAKKKEKSAKIQAYLKEWQKVKDDLQLEDHKIIPKGTPICLIDIPQQHVGDFLSVLEFVQLYADILKTKDVFHQGLELEAFRKMLTMKEHAGTFSDLVQMFMTTIFTLQEDEAEEYNEGGRIAESTQADEVEGEMGVTKAVELATKASKWSQTYLGTPLSKLPLDPTTITEVVRLHILSSGAAPGGRCATWRYQQRGGYSSLDDAGLRLRVEHPRLLRRLRTTHCADLPLDDKFLLLQCLMNQILSYATVRDVIEEKIESYKTMKHELRTTQIAERRREVELVAARSKLKKEAAAKKDEQKLTGDKARAVDKELEAELEKLNREGEDKKAQYKKKVHKLKYECFQHHSYIGSDRAYRRYWLNQTVPGLLVEAGDEPRGPCLDKPVPPAARGDDTLAYVTELFETRGGSDKENDSNANSRGNSPKKPLTNLNGLTQKLNGLESNLQQMKDLLVCTGDIGSCFVHGKGDFRPQWCVYHTEEQIEGLIQSLNKRGLRESDLRTGLELDKASIVDYIKKCPVHLLNPSVAQPVVATSTSTRARKFQPSLLVPDDSTVSEALELSLRDYILELEEKIFHGCLGAVKVKDREAWRGTLMLRGYDKQAEYLSWGPNKQYRDDYHLPDGVLKAPLGDPDKGDIKPIPENKYRDPGHYLGDAPKPNGVKQEPGVKAEPVEELGKPAADVVRGLASALLQIEQGIHHKYLKRPLGLDDKERKEREARGKSLDMDALERWEVSLMESASFAQIFLQLFTLDSSVSWGASILNASCRVCRRKTDPDNMLLCDSCNKGHHLYCLKPKLTKVPSGDWFCDQCKPKQERTPRKRRKLFSDEDVEEAVNNDESVESLDVDAGVCGACGSGGRLGAVCVGCANHYHAECALPPPGRAARRWLCAGCTNPPRDSEAESDDDTALVQLAARKPRRSSAASPAPATLNGHARASAGRARKSKDDSLNTSKKSRKSGSKTPLTNGVHEERGKKRAVTALHAAELQTLLRDVMRHKDCWPFYEPVDTNEVPDYLTVIEQPMDFSTIKGKLAGGEYATDQQFIADSTLVFVNCYTYNKDTHPVALAGVRLEEYFNKRCTALSLPTLPNIDLTEAAEDREAAAPQAKRARTK